MKNQQRFYGLIYLLIALADLLLICFNQNELRWFTKPLLMPVLMFLVYSNRSAIPLYTWVLAALTLSWAGDVLLQLKNMFIPGLVSFLLAHLCYIIYFINIKRSKKGWLQQQPIIVLPALLYIIIFLWLLYPYLGVLKIPVTIYGITISTMMLMCINNKQKVNSTAFLLFFSGALLFVISDSILAVHLFAYSSGLLGFCVMLTYAAAQYLLVKGSMHVTEHLN
jgi:uncharacterized membrane protein YhhN